MYITVRYTFENQIDLQNYNFKKFPILMMKCLYNVLAIVSPITEFISQKATLITIDKQIYEKSRFIFL